MKVEPLNPDQTLPGLQGKTVGDFWRWAYSDILSNANRSAFAEFVVAAALGIDHVPRIEWNVVDLLYNGRGIEVKTSAYIQSWHQERLSKIRFDIAPKRPWSPNTNKMGPRQKRSADCYVFCLFTPKKELEANVLDLSLWQFFVLPTIVINRTFGRQKSVGIGRLTNVSKPVPFESLRDEIDHILDYQRAASG